MLEEQMRKYRIAVLDDDESVREVIVEMLQREGLDAKAYDEAEKLLAEAFDACPWPSEQPELVLIDLHLKARKMQGMALVAELAARNNVDSAMVVMSASLSSADLEKATQLGASAGLAKPFDRSTLISTVERLAATARNQRGYRARENAHPNDLDPGRLSRPVFLSYASKDDVLANGLRRSIEARGIPVWYAPTTIPPGSAWKPRIEAGIVEAKIFVAFLTDNYFASDRCVEEFGQFEDRMLKGSHPETLILPVLSSLSNDARKKDLCQRIFDRYHYVDISRRFIDGLTAVLLRIEGVVGPSYTGTRRGRPRGSGGVSDKDPALSLPPHSEKSFN
jgi:FixJ family two-component response regulator